MALERTLGIVKPDGVARGLQGEVLQRIARAGLRVVGLKLVHLTQSLAEGFYAVHVGKPFFNDLVAYMTSGPVVLMALEGEGAIQRWRDLMGATNPEKAAPGTIRRDLAESMTRNTVHGSDAPETAAQEIRYCFSAFELLP